jgi:hypothetical protein
MKSVLYNGFLNLFVEYIMTFHSFLEDYGYEP